MYEQLDMVLREGIIPIKKIAALRILWKDHPHKIEVKKELLTV